MMWDPLLLVVNFVVGALGGLGAWFVGRRLASWSAERSKAVGLFAGVMFIAAGNATLGPLVKRYKDERELRQAGVALFGERGGEIWMQEMGPVMLQPGFVDKVKQKHGRSDSQDGGASGPPASKTTSQLNAELSARGFARLSIDEMQAMLDVRRAMAEGSLQLCAGFWTGEIQPAELGSGLKRLSEPQQRVWARSTARAVALELEALAPPANIPATVANEAVGTLVALFSADEQAAYARANQAGARAEDSCTSFRAVAAHMKELEAGHRETALRVITAPFLITRDPG